MPNLTETELEELNSISNKIACYENLGYRPPHVALVFVGDEKESVEIIKRRMQACESVGVKYTLYNFLINGRSSAPSIKELRVSRGSQASSVKIVINEESSKDPNEIVKLVKRLNKDQYIDGISVQYPPPESMTAFVALAICEIDPKKKIFKAFDAVETRFSWVKGVFNLYENGYIKTVGANKAPELLMQYQQRIGSQILAELVVLDNRKRLDEVADKAAVPKCNV